MNYIKEKILRYIKEGRIRVAVQPVFDSLDGKTLYNEILCRIDSGLSIDVSQFIIEAERLRIVDLVDEAVFEIVINTLLSKKLGYIAVNMSSYSLGSKRYVDSIITLYQKHAKSYPIIIEVTETYLPMNFEFVIANINKLKSFGFSFAIDDFGSGLISIPYLKKISADYIKINKMFIQNIENDSFNQAMVKSMIKLCNSLNIKLIAECVETVETHEYLLSIGIRYMQGFLFGMPYFMS